MEPEQSQPRHRSLTASTLPLDVLSRSDADLAADIAALRQTVDAARLLTALEQEQVRRADEQRAREVEADALLASMDAQRIEWETRYARDLDALRVAAPEERLSASQTAYVSGRQAYSIVNDLHNATGDTKYQAKARSWRVPHELQREGGDVAARYVLSLAGRNSPTLDKPWSAELSRFMALRPRRYLIGNGG